MGPLPNTNIRPELAGSKIFGKIDAKNGYWNIKLNKELTLYTTFNTPFELFKFL